MVPPLTNGPARNLHHFTALREKYRDKYIETAQRCVDVDHNLRGFKDKSSNKPVIGGAYANLLQSEPLEEQQEDSMPEYSNSDMEPNRTFESEIKQYSPKQKVAPANPKRDFYLSHIAKLDDERKAITQKFCDDYAWHSYSMSVGIRPKWLGVPEEKWRKYKADLPECVDDAGRFYEDMGERYGDLEVMLENTRASIEKNKVKLEVRHQPDPNR